MRTAYEWNGVIIVITTQDEKAPANLLLLTANYIL
jgi:hypothetical protein